MRLLHLLYINEFVSAFSLQVLLYAGHSIQQGHLFYFPQVCGYYSRRYLILQLGYVINFALVVHVRT